jgi:fumarylacetoacetate (FAA) hydrolase
MKLVTFMAVTPDWDERRGPAIGALVEDTVVDIACAQSWAQGARGLRPLELPPDMELLLVGNSRQPYFDHMREVLATLAGHNLRTLKGKGRAPVAHPLNRVRLFAPLPFPRSVRDFYAFEQHVKAARALRGLEMIPEWYEIPVFYFTNHNAIFGPYDDIPKPRTTQELDYELEVACVIGKLGHDIPVEDAEHYIAGYMVMNDWSARDLQRAEMKMNLGPAKGKDFATTLGPALVTPDELEDKRIERQGAGSVYDLTMTARINGKEYSRGNFKDITFTFAQMIAHASQHTALYPGEVLGSGTVGTGCILELRPETTGGWLKPGDVVEMEIERLGVLRNRVVDRK